MAVDFSDLDGSKVRVRILNAYRPEPEGDFFASYMVEDLEDRDSRVFLFRIDGTVPERHDVLYETAGVGLDHVTLDAGRHLVLEMLRHVTLVPAKGEARRVDIETGYLLNRIWHAGEDVYLTGDGLSVHRFEGNGSTPLTTGGNGQVRTFHAREDGSFLAGGDHGYLASGRAGVLRTVDIPVGFSVTAVLRASDGTIYVGCEGGLAYAIREDELLPIGAVGSDIISLCEFQGRVYWGTVGDGLLVLEDGALVPFCPLHFAYALNANAHALMVVTEEAAFVYEDGLWRGFAMVWDRFPRTLEFDVSALNG